MRKYGDRFRINTQLIEVTSGNHLWSDTYDGTFTDTIFVVQSNIAKKIAAELDVVITPEEEVKINKLPTTSLEAFELQIKGRYEMNTYWNTANDEHLIKVRDFYRSALKKDPEYLGAIRLLGNTFIHEQKYDSALYYAEGLVAVNPQYSGGHFLKAQCYFFMGKNDLAIESYSTALELSEFDSQDDEIWAGVALGRALRENGDVVTAFPYLTEGLKKMSKENSPRVYQTIAFAFTDIGDYDKASRYYKLAASRDPCYSISSHVNMFLSQNKPQQALEVIDTRCNQSCERLCSLMQFRIFLFMGEFDQSEQYFLEYLELDNQGIARLSHYHYEIGYVYHKQGRIEESNDVFNNAINDLESLDYKDKWTYLDLSRINAIKGNGSKAMEYLREYSKQHFTSGWHDFILIDPFFENLRDDPGFKAIVRQAQEEKAALRTQVQEMIASGELDL